MTFLLPAVLLTTGAPAVKDPPMNTVTRRWSHAELFDQGTRRGVAATAEGLVLDDRLLIEDDGPACGYSTVTGSEEILRQGIVLRKTLLVDRWPVREAEIVMLVYPVQPAEPNNGRHLLFRVNGHPDIVYEVKHFWTKAPVPAGYLKRGRNVIEARVQEPDTRFKTYVALDQFYRVGSADRLNHPNRSERSADGGRTWSDAKLGEKGAVDGEYSIRLRIQASLPEGWLESPLIDMATGGDASGLLRPVEIRKARLKVDAGQPANTGVEILARTGGRHVPADGDWTPWTPLQTGVLPDSLVGNRFLQFRLVLKSGDGAATPVVREVTLETESRAKGEPAAADGLRVLAAVNHPVVRGSLPFRHENPLNDKLRQLRRDYRLDQVVEGAGTEFERLLRLKSWVAKQWNWYLPGAENGDMCAWDALKILVPNTQGRPTGGYCLHFAVVFAQVCQSFGIPARIVNANYAVWGGHEMTEVWSNDYGKWVLMDANFDTCFFDRRTGIPLNALELHRLFEQTYYPGEVIDRDNWPRTDMAARCERVGLNLPVEAVVGGGARSETLKSYEWWKPQVELSAYCGGYGLLNLAELRWLPRSDFLSQPSPMPLNHGRSHWGWTGYYCWFDGQLSRSQEHSIHTDREADLYPTLNNVDFAAEAVRTGCLRLDLATDSPGFDHFELTANGRPVEVRSPGYKWTLAPGYNLIEMRSVDVLGNRGPASRLELTWMPPPRP
jgi:Transglutaminase-like superfamily